MPDGDDAARYHRLQLALSALGLAVGTIYLVLVLLSGVALHLTRAFGGWPWWAQVAIVAGVLAGAHRALVAPLAWIRGWWLPRRYGLLHQPMSRWLADQAKAGALAGVFGIAVLVIVYALLRALPTWWWLAAAIVLAVAYLLLAVIMPVWIVPLFYRLTPLADDELRGRLLALATRVGVPAVGVWVVDQSRKSRTANAAVVGLGGTRRILLFDTMLGFAPREIETVLAHELGHHVHHDMWRGLVMQSLLTLLSLAVAHVMLAVGVSAWSLRGVDDPAGVPWLALVVSAVGLLTLPLANGYSRRLERRADDFALRVTRDPEAFAAAMERLAGLNLAERRPQRLKEWLLYSHPAIDRRIARARMMSARAS